MVRRMWILFSFVSASLCVFGGSDVEPPSSDSAEFTLVKSDGGISLYERWYEHGDDLQAREVKATFLMNTDPESAIALIRNETRGREWNKNTRDYKVLILRDDQWICYLQYKLPWPMSNQDCVLEHTRYTQGSTVYIPFHAVDHADFPEDNRVERIPDIRGRWVFSPEGNSTRVEYYITTTPSGSLPTWVTDPFIRNNLLASLQAFRRILHSDALTLK